jgi:HEPN domain-containing protein
MERGKHREDWQKLCDTRIEDAEVLLRNGRYDAGYYLAGYAVECALKARIASLLLEGYFPPRPKYVQDNLYTHSLQKLHAAAELEEIFDDRAAANPVFGAQWNTVKDWTEASRYDTQDQEAAKNRLVAVRGVVECIKQYW